MAKAYNPAPMRRALLLLLLAAGCASSNPKRDMERFRREMEREESGERTLWIDIDHPFLHTYAGGGIGRFHYKKGGSRNESVESRTFRAVVVAPGGFLAEWSATTESMSGGTKAEMLDLFSFYNAPAWPNRRLRFETRPGFYFEKLNLVGAQQGDAEPWTLGFRVDLEGEVDIIKRNWVNFSLFATGRLQAGWGRTKVSGTTVASNAWGYGWEAGLRGQIARWTLTASWFDRNTELGGSDLVRGTEYGFEGAMLMVGLRW